VKKSDHEKVKELDTRVIDPSATATAGAFPIPSQGIWHVGVVMETFGFSLRENRASSNWHSGGNHPNWSNLVTEISGGAAGQILGAFGTSFDFAQVRQFRLGVRFEW